MAASAVHLYRRLRLTLPRPLSEALGRAAYTPRLLRGDPPTLQAFDEERLIDRILREDLPLDGVGIDLSERVVEIPWVLRSLPASPRLRVIDVGTAFAPIVYQRLLMRLPHEVDAADLAPAELPRIRGHRADIRALPFADRTYDVATCISTLEHIGMDNTQYDVGDGSALGADVEALSELGRVATRVLVTVPGGCDADMGWQRQYSPAAFRTLAGRAGLAVARMQCFEHDRPGGWRPADEAAIVERTYGDRAVNAAASICAELSAA